MLVLIKYVPVSVHFLILSNSQHFAARESFLIPESSEQHTLVAGVLGQGKLAASQPCMLKKVKTTVWAVCLFSMNMGTLFQLWFTGFSRGQDTVTHKTKG